MLYCCSSMNYDWFVLPLLGGFARYLSWAANRILPFHSGSSWVCSQLHQHFKSSFCANFHVPKKVLSQLSNTKKCANLTFVRKKLLKKCWWNWHLKLQAQILRLKKFRQRILESRHFFTLKSMKKRSTIFHRDIFANENNLFLQTKIIYFCKRK